ncbi:MAG: tetratricopeptide repeat protein [Candidatus Thorarchaeota archaeon]
MKPMGTITKYYPFIDEESKSILNSLMEESSSYYNFVQRLSSFVLDNEASVNLAYISAVHAWWTRTEENMKLIQEKYRDVPCVRPWAYGHRTAEKDQEEYHDAVVEAIDKAMEPTLDDWMMIELHLLHAFYHWPFFGDIDSLLEPLEKARSLTEANPKLNCFEPLIYAFEGMPSLREGAKKDAIDFFQRGQDLAELHNDSLYKYMNLLNKAFAVSAFDIQESLAHYEELYHLVQDLEIPYLLAEVLNDFAIVYETAGEYDLAISSHLEAIEMIGLDVTCCNLLSRIYSTLGDGQQALEWANMGFEYAGNLELPVLYYRKAMALALLNRLDEAERYLNDVHEMILKSGSEAHLGGYDLVYGMIELAKGDYLSALDYITKTHENTERRQSCLGQSLSLLRLAQAELFLVNQSPDSMERYAQGQWLSKLEKHAVDHNLPGVRMYAALFKSEFYQNQGQLRDALGTLRQALEITDSRGVKTLRRKIIKRIQELDQLILDEELAS